MFHFKTFCDDVNRFMSPRPYRYFLTHNNSASCQMEYDENDAHKFRLYFYIPHNETHDQIRVYNESTDFVVWDIEKEGLLVDYVPLKESNFRFNFNDYGRVPYWSQNLAAFGSQDDPRVMTNIFPVVPDNTSELVDTATGTALFNKDLHQMLKSRTQAMYSHYLLTDIDDRVVLESSVGAVYPVQVENKKPFFPKINELNHSIWNSVYQNVIELQIDTPIIVNLSQIQYMIMKRVIYTRSQMSFYLVMLFEIDPIMTRLYYPTTMIFTLCTLVIIFFLFTMHISLNHLKKMINKKLNLRKRANPLLSFDIINMIPSTYSSIKRNIHEYCGKIEFAIHRLRRIELKYPEDVMMNNIIDNVVEEMSRTKNELFNIEYEELEKKKELLISRVINNNNDTNFGNNKINNIHCNVAITSNLYNNNQINKVNYSNSAVNLSLNNINLRNVSEINKGCEFCEYLNYKMPKPRQTKRAESNKLPFEISCILSFSHLLENKQTMRQSYYSHSENEINENNLIDNFQNYNKNSQSNFKTNINDEPKENLFYHDDEEPEFKSVKEKKKKGIKNKINGISFDPNKKKVLFVINNNTYTSKGSSTLKKISKKIRKKVTYSNPHKHLCLYFLKIIRRSQLFFLEFDPDMLMMFILSITKKYFNNEIIFFKIESMRLLNKILTTSGNLQLYIYSKIDVLILYISVITRKINSFSNSKQKGIDILKGVQSMKYTEIILQEFHSYFSKENNYFDSMIFKLLEETTNDKKMEIFGEFSNRIQSPNFSIFGNRNDNFLFLKVIIVFTDFTPYLSSREYSDIDIFSDIHNIVFAENERNDKQFIAEFHYEMATKVVYPWLKMLETISPLNEIKRNLEESIDYWGRKCKQSFSK